MADWQDHHQPSRSNHHQCDKHVTPSARPTVSRRGSGKRVARTGQRLLVAVRRTARELSGRTPSSALVDALLDERAAAMVS
jgi:hypothetical protein